MKLNDTFDLEHDGLQWILSERLQTRSAKDRSQPGKPRVKERYFATLGSALTRFVDLQPRHGQDIAELRAAIEQAMVETRELASRMGS